MQLSAGIKGRHALGRYVHQWIAITARTALLDVYAHQANENGGFAQQSAVLWAGLARSGDEDGVWSGRGDLNARPPAPKEAKSAPGALSSFANS